MRIHLSKRHSTLLGQIPQNYLVKAALTHIVQAKTSCIDYKQTQMNPQMLGNLLGLICYISSKGRVRSKSVPGKEKHKIVV